MHLLDNTLSHEGGRYFDRSDDVTKAVCYLLAASAITHLSSDVCEEGVHVKALKSEPCIFKKREVHKDGTVHELFCSIFVDG